MIKYVILSDDNTFDLSRQVTESINNGWQLQGGVSCSLSEADEYRYTLYAQALIKEVIESEVMPTATTD